MNDNIIEFPGLTTVDLPPDDVLKSAMGHLTDVVVIGCSEERGFYVASSSADLAYINLLLDLAKRDVLDLADGNK